MLHISHKPTLQPKITKKYVLPTHRQTTERQGVINRFQTACKAKFEANVELNVYINRKVTGCIN